MCKESNAAINEAHILCSERDEEDESRHLEGPGCSREEEVAKQGLEQCAGLESVSAGRGGSGRAAWRVPRQDQNTAEAERVLPRGPFPGVRTLHMVHGAASSKAQRGMLPPVTG